MNERLKFKSVATALMVFDVDTNQYVISVNDTVWIRKNGVVIKDGKDYIIFDNPDNNPYRASAFKINTKITRYNNRRVGQNQMDAYVKITMYHDNKEDYKAFREYYNNIPIGYK